jgi:hypothetical protein
MNKQIFQIFNIVALIGTLIVNYLSNPLPLNGRTTGQLFDEILTLFVPADLTFAIWSYIYFINNVRGLSSKRVIQKGKLKCLT